MKDKVMMEGLKSPQMFGFMKNIILYNFDRFSEFDTHVTFSHMRKLVEEKLKKAMTLKTYI